MSTTVSIQRRFVPRLEGLAVILAVAVMIAGCATEVGQHTMLTTQPRPAKPENYPIDVYTNGLPTRPYERIAVLDAHCESQGFMTPNLKQDGLPVLIRQARAAGCDGIIEIQERHSSNWTLETKTRHYTATGISYTDKP